jgi:hypothetical protein
MIAKLFNTFTFTATLPQLAANSGIDQIPENDPIRVPRKKLQDMRACVKRLVIVVDYYVM